MRQDMTMDEVMEYQGRLYFMPREKNPGTYRRTAGILWSDRFPQKDSTKTFRWYETKTDGLPGFVDRAGDPVAG